MNVVINRYNKRWAFALSRYCESIEHASAIVRKHKNSEISISAKEKKSRYFFSIQNFSFLSIFTPGKGGLTTSKWEG